MNEVVKEIVCCRKRGRDDTQVDEMGEMQEKKRSNMQSDISIIFESLEWEDGNDIDEERVYNLMRELMQEIGIDGNNPLPPSQIFCCVSCDSAPSSSTDCCFTSKQFHSTGIELGKNEVDGMDWGVHDRAKSITNCKREDGFFEDFDDGNFLISDSCICNLNKAISADEFSHLEDDVTSAISINGCLSETGNWVL